MKRIMLIGCGGAGKSTLARVLGEKTGIPVVHLDKLWWRPGWTHIPREEFDRELREVTAGEEWILDGNYDRTMGERLGRCDTVIWLDFPRWACLRGVAKRILTTYGKVRPDMGEGCPERIDWEFLCWVWNFNKEHREKFLQYRKESPEVEWILLKNRREVRRFLESI